MARLPYSEAQLLAIYFSEMTWHRMQEQAKYEKQAKRQQRQSPGGTEGMTTDTEIGDDDEQDWFEEE